MFKEPGLGEVPEQPKARERCTVEVGETKAQVRKRKSEYPGYARAEITFGDIYRSELVEKFNWTEDQANSFDEQLFAKLSDKLAVIDWQDREFFTVDIPESATRDIVSDVEAALLLTFKNPLEVDQLETFKKLREEAEDKAGELAAQELAKIREEKTLFQAYKKKPGAESPADHEGYCIIRMIKIKKVSGLGYDDEEFLGREFRKTAVKPNMVILSISIQGDPFDRLYRGRVIQREEFYGKYESELQKIIRGLQESPKEVAKISYQISMIRNKDEADGERLKLLCTREFAERATTAIKNLYSDLEDISKD